MTDIDEVNLNCKRVDRSHVNGGKENFLFTFSLSAPPGVRVFGEPTSILFENVNIDNIDDITISLQEEDGRVLDFDGEILTFTV